MSRLVQVQKPAEDKPKTPWSKPDPGQTKTVELSPEAFRILSKFAAKRGLMVGKTPSDALEAMFKQFRVEETS